jgi:hypothetical protein
MELKSKSIIITGARSLSENWLAKRRESDSV